MFYTNKQLSYMMERLLIKCRVKCTFMVISCFKKTLGTVCLWAFLLKTRNVDIQSTKVLGHFKHGAFNSLLQEVSIYGVNEFGTPCLETVDV